MQLTKRKKIIIGSVIGLIIIGLVVGVILKNRNQPEPVVDQEPTKRRITDPVNIIPVSERPYVSITPLEDGRRIEINILYLNKDATQAQYDLEYQSGSMLQGAMGLIALDSLPNSERLLLGSCSAGGACSYHEDVTGGNLLLKFSNSAGSYAVKTDWRYFDNSSKSKQVASKDAKFQLEADALLTQRYLIVFNSPGLPPGLDGEVIADHYALTSSGSLATASSLGELTIRLNQESDTATIVGYNGKEWLEFETTVDGKQATAQVQLVELYTVIQ